MASTALHKLGDRAAPRRTMTINPVVAIEVVLVICGDIVLLLMFCCGYDVYCLLCVRC